MLDAFVMEPAETGAVRGIERSTAQTDAHDVMHLDPSPAGIPDALEPAAILVAGPYQLACLLPAWAVQDLAVGIGVPCFVPGRLADRAGAVLRGRRVAVAG